MKRALKVVIALAVVAPSTASSQEMITSFFEKATDIAAFGQAAWLTSDKNLDTRGSAMLGYGAEVLFSLKDDPKAAFGVEVGFGFNYLTGFRSANPSLDLRGSMRTLPELSVYATYQKTGTIEPYIGVHTGLLDLWHTQAYDASGQQYTIDSESFQAGVSGGVFVKGVWAELSYRIRNFPSLNYALPDESNTVPLEFPRSFDFSGWNVRVGYQFSIAKDK